VIPITARAGAVPLTKISKLAAETKATIMHATTIVSVLAVTASVANAAPMKGKQAGGYTLPDNGNTRLNQQDRFHISY
jgi:hypothetical protein